MGEQPKSPADSLFFFAFCCYIAQMDEPTSWVAARLSALGDVTLLTGVLDYWHRVKGWRFTVLTRKAWAPLFEGHPAVRDVTALSAADLALRHFAPRMKQLARDHAGEGLLDLHGTLRTRLLSSLWQGPVRRCPKFSVRRRLFLACSGRLFGEPLRKWNVPQRYSLAVTAVPPPRSELIPRLFCNPVERERAAALLAPIRIPGAPLVALHPYAAHPHKTWPAESWLKLTALLEAKGIPWFSIGRGPELFGAALPHDFRNRTTLRETCALLEAADALVTGDSGPMHLACGVGTPVTALFGPTCEEWGFFPQGPRDVVLQADMPCRPCSLHGKRRCDRDSACMRRIRPQEVLEVLDRMTAPQNGLASSAGTLTTYKK